MRLSAAVAKAVLGSAADRTDAEPPAGPQAGSPPARDPSTPASENLDAPPEPAHASRTAQASEGDAEDDVEMAAQYMVGEDTKHVLVRIYDRRTGRTVRVIPPTIMVSAILKLLRLKSVTRLDKL
jgi:hypothetical protein